jgi:anti-sigma regulatory factor (Ser/Thr protein kinase)
MTEPGTLGTLTGPDLPGAPESRPADGGAFRAQRAHRSYLEVAAEPGALPHARRFSRQALEGWGLGRIADDAELIVSELMSNAISAAPAAGVALYLAADPGRLTLLVWDASPDLPARHRHDDDAVSGRGLEIIDALADRWGTWGPVASGKVVWAWLDLDR